MPSSIRSSAQVFLVTAATIFLLDKTVVSVAPVHVKAAAVNAWPEMSVIQGQGSKVYLIFDKTRHWIPDPATLRALGIQSQIRKINVDDEGQIPLGKPIPQLPGNVLQDSATQRVYLVEAGRLRYVPTPDILQSLGVEHSVQTVNTEVLHSLPVGPPMAQTSGTMK